MSWKIGTVFGIPVRLHVSMVLVLLLALGWVDETGPWGVVLALGTSVLVFGSVLVHEVGHALVGRLFGVVTQDILLTPIGGMARMRSLPTSPRAEITIALAGPLVSFAIAALSWTAVVLVAAVWPASVPAWWLLFQINVMLGAFNLIPAFPLDGGRVLRGLLALRSGHLQATRVAARVGRTLAVIAALWSLYDGMLAVASGQPFGNWSLLFISMFIYVAAGQEERYALWRYMQEQQRSPFGWGWPGGPVYRWPRSEPAGGESARWDGRDPQEGWTTGPGRTGARTVSGKVVIRPYTPDRK